MFRILITLLFGFSFSAFSAIDISTGSGGDFSGFSGGSDFPQPPTSKRTYTDRRVVSMISTSCLDTNSRWGGNPLEDTATAIVVGVPIIDSNNDKKYLALEFTASEVAPASASGDATEDDNAGTIASKVYLLNSETWIEDYTTGTNIALHSDQVSSELNHITLAFDLTNHIKEQDNAREVITRQINNDVLAPLSIYMQWRGRTHGGSHSVNYVPSANGKAGTLTVDLKIPIKIQGVSSGREGSSDQDLLDKVHAELSKVSRKIHKIFFGGKKKKKKIIALYSRGCKYYTSPLMAFFDDKRPRFTGLSSFPLIKDNKYITWPEVKSPGYFVALDVNQDGKITEAYELFGNSGVDVSYANGFESLKRLDSNKDELINKKDQDFNKLVLWKDLNGNGIGEREEQVLLSEKIKNISLKYEKSYVTFGKRAKELEKSNFVFVNEKGKEQTGHIGDIWFAPVPTSRVNIVSKKKVTKHKLAVK